MKIVMFLLLVPLLSVGQSESHNFTTYDTSIKLGTDSWLVRISRPSAFFTLGSPDTVSRPGLFMMPGEGEQGPGASSAKLQSWGPHYWLANGWDGSIILGNGIHYPLLFTVIYVNNQWPNAFVYYNLLSALIKEFHIRPRGVHVTGLSQGAFSNGALIKFELTAGAETGMQLVTSAALFEGTPDPLPAPYNSWDRDTVAYQVWAKKYGGKYFYLEGNGGDNFRDGWRYAGPMNRAVPGSAYFSYEKLGAGAHCCWNDMYNPANTNWTCAPVAALGPNNASSQLGTNTMGTYKTPANVFQWMLRQGDTTLIVSGPPSVPHAVITIDSPIINYPNTIVHLNPNSSTATNGNLVAYQWTQPLGPNTAIWTSIGNNAMIISGLIPGVYKVNLYAQDALNNIDTATTYVRVNGPPPCQVCPVCPPPRTAVVIWTIVNGLPAPTISYSDGKP